jgi:hypothetical protein
MISFILVQNVMDAAYVGCGLPLKIETSEVEESKKKWTWDVLGCLFIQHFKQIAAWVRAYISVLWLLPLRLSGTLCVKHFFPKWKPSTTYPAPLSIFDLSVNMTRAHRFSAIWPGRVAWRCILFFQLIFLQGSGSMNSLPVKDRVDTVKVYGVLWEWKGNCHLVVGSMTAAMQFSWEKLVFSFLRFSGQGKGTCSVRSSFFFYT